jgi:cyclic beta-1,2-glucan synthetase
MGEGRMAATGQMLYVYDLAQDEAYSPTFIPLRRRDISHDVHFMPGAVIYSSTHNQLSLELTVFVHPEEPIEFKILRITNLSSHERLLRVVPALEIILAETPTESLGCVEFIVDDDLQTISYRNPHNNFVKGWAFVATSLSAEFAETSRRRFLGNESRDPVLPYMVEHGHPDAGAPEHERKVAAFCGTIKRSSWREFDSSHRSWPDRFVRRSSKNSTAR